MAYQLTFNAPNGGAQLGVDPLGLLTRACPFCFRRRLFLLESGQLDRFVLREFAPGTPEEGAIRAELAPHVDKPTFPTAAVAPGSYLKNSDALIARYAGEAGVEPDSLPTFRAYAAGLLPMVIALHKENAALKQRAG